MSSKMAGGEPTTLFLPLLHPGSLEALTCPCTFEHSHAYALIVVAAARTPSFCRITSPSSAIFRPVSLPPLAQMNTATACDASQRHRKANEGGELLILGCGTQQKRAALPRSGRSGLTARKRLWGCRACEHAVGDRFATRG